MLYVVLLLTISFILLLHYFKLIDVSGGCEDGTTFTFVMKDGGTRIPQTLSGVKKNESLTFSGTFYGSNITGIITLTQVEGSDKTKTKVDYSFDINGCVGFVVKTLRSEHVIGGTENGLANMVRLSEEAQQKQ
jgi:hypothetical protein